MFYYTNFNPFDPPRLNTPAPPPPAPPKPPAPLKPEGPAGPPRMAILSGGGKEALVALPPSYEVAIKVAQEKFEIPTGKWSTRLGMRKAEVPNWLAKWCDGEVLFMWVLV